MNPQVILADDERCIRQTLALVVRGEKVDVIGEAANGEEALSMCRRLRPTFLLTDLRLPVLDAVSVLMRIRAEQLEIPVMIYTGSEDERLLAATLEAAPAVLVHKTDGLDDLRMGIRCATQGRSYFSPKPALLNSRPKTSSPAPALTPAETELLRLLASGMSNKMAAAHLQISEHTVCNRREHLMQKLNAHDVTALVRFAVRMGLVGCDT